MSTFCITGNIYSKYETKVTIICPGPEWVKGFCDSVKSALSQIATNRNK